MDVSRIQRTVAPAAMVLAVLGAIICVVLVVGVWIGESWASDRVSRLETAVNSALDQGVQASTTASQKLSALEAQFTDISNQAAAVAADPNASDSSFNQIRQELMDLGTRYDDFKAGYQDLHARVTGALDSLDTVGQLVPAVSDLESRLSDAMTQLDTQVQQLDASITTIRQQIADVTALPSTIKSVAASTISSLISGASDFTDAVTARIQTAQAKVQDAASTADSALFWTALVATVVLLWGVVLNIALFALARRWRASPPTPPAPSAPPAQPAEP